ncbi:MAG: NAD-dependent epimerase/dehydratase family protein [Muribaculaceae bacterium]
MQKLLLTGSSGFLGSNIYSILARQYEVFTLAKYHGDYKIDLAIDVPTHLPTCDIVLHAAGKVHIIPQTKEEIKSFYDVNLQGTKNLCKGLELSGKIESFIFISTVSVYGCGSGENISEDYPLNGTSHYAISNRMAEEFLLDWCASNGIKLIILRPSLVAGRNPLGNLKSMIAMIKKHCYFNIAHGNIRKSVLMADDIAHIVPLLAGKEGIYNMCSDENPTFEQIAEIVSEQLGVRKPISIPYWIAKCMATVGDCLGAKAPINTAKLNKMVNTLTFSNAKICRETGWTPMNVLENFKIK